MRDSIAANLCATVAISLFTACSSDPSPAVTPPFVTSAAITHGMPVDWSYEKDAIDLHVEAAADLNLFHKTPHTLLLCTYHLRDPNAFKQLQDEKGGLQKLLDCSRFDPSVLYARRIVIQPGQRLDESLDRSEGTRFIAFAAGYYKQHKDRVTASLPVPLLPEKRGGTVLQSPQKLRINLRLGPQEIAGIEAVPKNGKD